MNIARNTIWKFRITSQGCTCSWCTGQLNWCKNLLYIKKFLCVCPVIDHEFRHNMVKVAVDPRGHSWVDPQTTLTMFCWNPLSITEQTHLKLTSICLDYFDNVMTEYVVNNRTHTWKTDVYWSRCPLLLIEALHK